MSWERTSSATSIHSEQHKFFCILMCCPTCRSASATFLLNNPLGSTDCTLNLMFSFSGPSSKKRKLPSSPAAGFTTRKASMEIPRPPDPKALALEQVRVSMSFVNLTSHLFGGKLVIFLKEEREMLDILYSWIAGQARQKLNSAIRE